MSWARATALLAGVLLAMFWVFDSWLYHKEPGLPTPAVGAPRLAIEGSINFLLIVGVIGAVLMSGLWDSRLQFDVFGAHLELQNLLRDAILVALGLLSLAVTPQAVRERNGFHWAPIVEVAKIFAGIFVTIIPVIALLGAGRNDALAGVVSLVASPEGKPLDTMVFWMTACSRRSSTMRRPTSCSSISRAAMRPR